MERGLGTLAAPYVLPSLWTSEFSSGSSVFGWQMHEEGEHEGSVGGFHGQAWRGSACPLATFHCQNSSHMVSPNCHGAGEYSRALGQGKWSHPQVLPSTHLLCHNLKDWAGQSTEGRAVPEWRWKTLAFPVCFISNPTWNTFLRAKYSCSSTSCVMPAHSIS